MSDLSSTLFEIAQSILNDRAGTVSVYISSIGWIEVEGVEDHGSNGVWIINPVDAPEETIYVPGERVVAIRQGRDSVLL